MNSSTTLLGKIIVTSAVEKREAVELSNNSNYLTFLVDFLISNFHMLINMICGLNMTRPHTTKITK